MLIQGPAAVRQKRPLDVSASIGIACYPESGTVREALSLRADEAMYKAKAAGKRRYAVAS